LLWLWSLSSCQDTTQAEEGLLTGGRHAGNEAFSRWQGEILEEAAENRGRSGDSLRLTEYSILRSLQDASPGSRYWSMDENWKVSGDSLISFIEGAEAYGLFSSEYQLKAIRAQRRLLEDSLAREDESNWAKAELLMTDAFVHLSRHLKMGRLQRDSITLRSDSLYTADHIAGLLNRVSAGESVRSVLESEEPGHPGYRSLRQSLPALLDSLNLKPYTYLSYPQKDSLAFIRQLQKRLSEDKYLPAKSGLPDSLTLSNAIRKAQLAKKLKADGKPGPALVNALNNTGYDKFIRIAMNLDRYKHLPSAMPDRYIWVNIPSYSLQLFDSGKVKLESKIIVGTAENRTPVLNSSIRNIVVYPQWNVPYSIVFKEMLPQIQRSTGYLKRKNLVVVDRRGRVVDPSGIQWSKLGPTNFPYGIRQLEGDNNSLGVMKFNFPNKYAVYLHDTNARGLFSRGKRSLSHGCVRVQNWQELAAEMLVADSLSVSADSLKAVLGRREQRSFMLQAPTPIYLRYFTAYAADGRIRFLEDIYAEDRLLREKYFTRR
jgi:murein L,D-transpeptidase YcbB/YkuD